jgi:ferredoxin
MHVCIDESTCSGCGLCVDACPEVFEIGEDGLARVLIETVPSDMEDACYEAAAQCPTEAITIAVAGRV